MEIPFATVVDTEFTNAALGSGLATFILSEPPLFYLEQMSSPRLDAPSTLYWKRCTDWTEGFQATQVLRHDLIGSAAELAHVVRILHPHTLDSEASLHSPEHDDSEPPPTPMELPAPPMAGLGPEFQYRDSSPVEEHEHRRPLTAPEPADTPDNWTPFSHDAPYQAPHSAPSGSFPPPAYNGSFVRGVPASAGYAYDGYDQLGASPLGNYGVPIAHSLGSRSFSGNALLRSYGNERVTYEEERPQQHSSEYAYEAPSPPLLTTPYHPPPHLIRGFSDHADISGGPIISGLPGMLYDSGGDHYQHLNE